MKAIIQRIKNIKSIKILFIVAIIIILLIIFFYPKQMLNGGGMPSFGSKKCLCFGFEGKIIRPEPMMMDAGIYQDCYGMLYDCIDGLWR